MIILEKIVHANSNIKITCVEQNNYLSNNTDMLRNKLLSFVMHIARLEEHDKMANHNFVTANILPAKIHINSEMFDSEIKLYIYNLFSLPNVLPAYFKANSCIGWNWNTYDTQQYDCIHNFLCQPVTFVNLSVLQNFIDTTVLNKKNSLLFIHNVYRQIHNKSLHNHGEDVYLMDCSIVIGKDYVDYHINIL